MNHKIAMSLCLLYQTLTIAHHQIMSYEEYAQTRHARPYTYQLSKPNQKLFYFGANHSCDPTNEQYPPLEHFWHEFLQQTGGKNCVVLVEGSKRPVAATKEEAITKCGGEGGVITYLAHQNNVPVECPEPDKEFLRNELSKYFSEDEIHYYDFAHCVQQFQRCLAVDSTLTFEKYYQKYGTSTELEHMKDIHQKLFHTQFDPYNHEFFYEITNPVVQITVNNEVCRQASIIRDEHIVNHIENLVQQGKNVFVVYGCTHAIMQEAAIRKI